MIDAGKVAGPDNIPPEALRADLNISSDILYDLFGKVWKGEEMPRDWNKSYIVTLPKKGDRRECENYGGIPLISVVGKVLNKSILLRLQILRRKWRWIGHTLRKLLTASPGRRYDGTLRT